MSKYAKKHRYFMLMKRSTHLITITITVQKSAGLILLENLGR